MVCALCSLLLQQRLHTHKPAHTPCIPPHFLSFPLHLLITDAGFVAEAGRPAVGASAWEREQRVPHLPRIISAATSSEAKCSSSKVLTPPVCSALSRMLMPPSLLWLQGDTPRELVNHLPSGALTIHYRLPWSNAASFPSASCFLALTSSVSSLLLPPCRSLGSMGSGGMGKEAGAAAEVASGMLGAASATLTPPASNLGLPFPRFTLLLPSRFSAAVCVPCRWRGGAWGSTPPLPRAPPLVAVQVAVVGGGEGGSTSAEKRWASIGIGSATQARRQGGSRRAGGGSAAEGRAGGGRAGVGRAGGGRAGGGRAVGGRAVGGRAVGGRAVGGRAVGGRAVGGRAVGGREGGGRAGGGRAVGGRAGGGRAVGGRAGGGRAIGEEKGQQQGFIFAAKPQTPLLLQLVTPQVEGEGVGVNTATPSRPSPCGRAGGSGGRGGGHHSTRLGWDGRVLRLSRPNKAEGGSTGARAVEWSPPFSLTSSSPPFSLPSQQHPSRTIVESRPPKIHPSPPLPPSQQTASWRSAWLWKWAVCCSYSWPVSVGTGGVGGKGPETPWVGEWKGKGLSPLGWVRASERG
ncbi:unnamed protein product [Closterium sp. NIES-64]|nr:unnamed protein product [Closterium sp. NIES-64]